MKKNLLILIITAFLLTMVIPVLASGEDGTPIFVIGGKVDAAYRWILENPLVTIRISKGGVEGDATLYPASSSYIKIYIAFGGYAVKTGEEISIGVFYDGLKIWSKSYKITPQDIAQASCTINVEPAKTGTEDKTQLIIVGGHIDETIQDLLPTIIIVELNGMQIPAEINDENNTYTATFITFGGYVAGVGDVVTISMDKNGVNLFSKKHILTQTEINEKNCIMDLGLSSTAISSRKTYPTTWGALKR